MTAGPDWTFGSAWPYRPRWFTAPDGRMHYIDEGPPGGRPVVLVHGNPTWGFVYRNFVGPLTAAGHRVIVPDHLGFGRSDKPHDARLCRGSLCPKEVAEEVEDEPVGFVRCFQRDEVRG